MHGIGICEQQPFGARVSHAGVQRILLAAPAGAKLVRRNNAHSREAGCDLLGAVSRVVVYDDQLKADILLAEQRFQAGAQRSLFIARRHNDGNLGNHGVARLSRF